jgi:thioredoxin reductase (NADPH)
MVVVGGGDSAMEYALFCANLAERVTVIHRRDKLKASRALQERAFANPKITFVWNSVVEEILGEERVTGVRVRNLKTGETQVIPCEAVFIAIGHAPATEIFRGWLELDEEGYIVTHDHVKTSVDGVFAAGDVHDKKYRQAVTAAGFGCMAALEAIRFVEGVKLGIVKPRIPASSS